MALSLEKNQSISLEKTAGTPLSTLRLALGWDPVKPTGFLSKMLGSDDSIDLDASCILLDSQFHSLDMVWFCQLESKDGSVQHSGDNRTGEGDGDDEVIYVDLLHLPAEVQHLILTVNSFQGQSFDQVENAYCRVLSQPDNTELARFNLSEKGSHTGVIMASLSRIQGDWQFKAIGQPSQGRTAEDLISLAVQAVRP